MSPSLSLSTDLYELTMMAGYYVSGLRAPATFELYVRELPRNRSFLVAAGLEQALEYLESLRFTDGEIDYLRRLPMFEPVPRAFFDEYLPSVRFTGEVWAVPEGTPVFAHEPILRVTAPIAEAQLVETALLATIGFQTSIASKAARVVHAAAGRSVIEFGSRRAHGTGAACLAARAAYLGGCHGTSNVEAGFRFGIPVSGTMAHSWVMSFEREADAFEAFYRLYGRRSTLLLDTYDTVAAATALAATGMRPRSVRLDSGDLAALSRQVRVILDAHGLTATRIFGTGDLDEHKIATLVAAGTPIDGFGVGTALSTSKDAPALGGVYKLVAFERDGRVIEALKLSEGKLSYPGAKQVWRQRAVPKLPAGDLLALATEAGPPGARPLLGRVMDRGRRTASSPPLASLREACRQALDDLPHGIRRLDRVEAYPVGVSDALRSLTDRLTAAALSRLEP
jgi:nicotinate phosphoribosyltransferase